MNCSIRRFGFALLAGALLAATQGLAAEARNGQRDFDATIKALRQQEFDGRHNESLRRRKSRPSQPCRAFHCSVALSAVKAAGPIAWQR